VTKPSPPQTDAMGLDPSILEILPCLAYGSYIEEVVFDAHCLSMCQRPENPCIVDIDFLLEGDDVYEIVPEYTLFSLDTTDGFNGSWHVLQPVESDAQHFGQFLEVHGQVTGRYVADMCDHVSTFFSEPRVCFRLTFRVKQSVNAPFGAFDDEEEEEEQMQPKLTPTGGCRTRFFGPRIERS
jgi:hypothetical protein